MEKIEKSVFMLKPDSIRYKQEIMSTIEKAGIPIKEWREFILEEKYLRALYPRASGEDWHKLKEHLLNKKVLAAIVEGENIIERLYKVCGEKVQPFECVPDSIRNKFKDIVTNSFENVIHRPKNKQEADEHIVLFFPPNRN